QDNPHRFPIPHPSQLQEGENFAEYHFSYTHHSPHNKRNPLLITFEEILFLNWPLTTPLRLPLDRMSGAHNAEGAGQRIRLPPPAQIAGEAATLPGGGRRRALGQPTQPDARPPRRVGPVRTQGEGEVPP